MNSEKWSMIDHSFGKQAFRLGQHYKTMKDRRIWLTPMCWKSQERMTLVACLGRMPLLALDELSSWLKKLRSWFSCNWSCGQTNTAVRSVCMCANAIHTVIDYEAVLRNSWISTSWANQRNSEYCNMSVFGDDLSPVSFGCVLFQVTESVWPPAPVE